MLKKSQTLFESERYIVRFVKKEEIVSIHDKEKCIGRSIDANPYLIALFYSDYNTHAYKNWYAEQYIN